jgi:hypothetical protein
VVTWNSLGASTTDTSGEGIQARVYNSNGVAVGASFQVNTTTMGAQENPSVVGLANGGFAVAWDDFSTGSGRTVLRTFDASGNPTSGEFLVDGSGHADYAPQLALLADGRIAVTWEGDQSVPQDTLGWHTEMQIVDPRTSGDTLTPDAGGADLVGTPFDDTFVDGPGNDRFTCNGGLDTVSFAKATGGVTVNLALATAQAIGGGMGTDTLSGIHRVIGSSFFDTITLGADNDTVQAGSGGSDIVANGGDDVLLGGAGGGPSGLGNTIYAFGGSDFLQGGPVRPQTCWWPRVRVMTRSMVGLGTTTS